MQSLGELSLVSQGRSEGAASEADDKWFITWKLWCQSESFAEEGFSFFRVSLGPPYVAKIRQYIGQIVRMTREMDRVLMGASSRAAVHLLQAAKVQALMAGRQFVIPDDVKRVCRPVLRHRITLQPDAYVEGFATDDVLTNVLERVEVPR